MAGAINYLGGGTGADKAGTLQQKDYYKKTGPKFEATLQKVQKSEESKNSTKISSPKPHLNKVKAADDGTDFALKELSKDMEQQVLGVLWNLAFAAGDKEYEGGLGEEIFHKDLVAELVKLSSKGEMGEIAQSIYNDLKREQGK